MSGYEKEEINQFCTASIPSSLRELVQIPQRPEHVPLLYSNGGSEIKARFGVILGLQRLSEAGGMYHGWKLSWFIAGKGRSCLGLGSPQHLNA